MSLLVVLKTIKLSYEVSQIVWKTSFWYLRVWDILRAFRLIQTGHRCRSKHKHFFQSILLPLRWLVPSLDFWNQRNRSLNTKSCKIIKIFFLQIQSYIWFIFLTCKSVSRKVCECTSSAILVASALLRLLLTVKVAIPTIKFFNKKDISNKK